MDAETLRKHLADDASITVLDIRPSAQRAEWHIPGSQHVDAYAALKRQSPDALAGVELPDDRLVVTVCEAGRTSETAAELLRRRGLRAESLVGGMRAWSQAWNAAPVPLADARADVLQVRRTGKGCLSYLVASEGQAAVIDAAVHPSVYVRLAEERGWKITQVVDTHVHADHVSRARPLAERTGARLLLPAQDRADFGFVPVHDGDVLQIGSARLRALRTPGHTPESTCYLLEETALFSGDTLFLDGVGRPDLETSAEEAHIRATALYDALQRLLREVPDEAFILPGHTSRPTPFDGKPVGETLRVVRDRVGTLSLPEGAFVKYLLDRIPPTPPNHERIVRLNERGSFPEAELDNLEAGANRCAVS